MVDEVGRSKQDEKDEYSAAEERQVTTSVGSTEPHVLRCYIARMLLSNRSGEFATRIAMKWP
jgi:hypothetical protein